MVPEPTVIVPVFNAVDNPTQTSFVPVIVPATGKALIETPNDALDGDIHPLLSVIE